jgi:hypothetical protein
VTSRQTPQPVERGPDGRLKSGSLNPGGFSKAQREVMEALKGDGAAARARMLELMASEDEKVAYQASTKILEYAVGKPKEMVEVTADGLADLMRAMVTAAGPRPTSEPDDPEDV